MGRKYVNQFIVYVIEVILVAILFVIITSYFCRIENSYENIERFFTGIVVYQGLVFIFNKNSLDVKKDMILAYKTYLRYCKLYLETNSDIVLINIKSTLDSMESEKIFLSIEYKKALTAAYELIVNNNIPNFERLLKIECEIIKVEHLSEFQDLKWQQSLFLKLLK